MTAEDVFGVDLSALTHTTDQMEACHASLSDLATDLERRVAALHLSWGGTAAQAHHQAQTAWEHGFAEMREALTQMRAAGRTAHANYSSAADTNLRLWQQIS